MHAPVAVAGLVAPAAVCRAHQLRHADAQIFEGGCSHRFDLLPQGRARLKAGCIHAAAGLLDAGGKGGEGQLAPTGLGVARTPGDGADVLKVDREQGAIAAQRREGEVVVVEAHGAIAEPITPAQQHISAIALRHLQPIHELDAPVVPLLLRGAEAIVRQWDRAQQRRERCAAGGHRG